MCLIPHVQGMESWPQPQRRINGEPDQIKDSFGSKLNPIDQRFMLLHKRRLGSLNQELSDKYYVSQSTVSRNAITWRNFLYRILGAQPIWPSRDQMKRYLPAIFLARYPNRRVINDCKITAQPASSLMLISELYSSYKGRNTLKCLDSFKYLEKRDLIP